MVINCSVGVNRKVLERLKGWRGTPRVVRLDDGPELTSVQLQAWCESNSVELRFIQPGKPNQNAFIERFNRTFRSEVLNAYLFERLDQVREVAWWWMVAYNEERPHEGVVADAIENVPADHQVRPQAPPSSLSARSSGNLEIESAPGEGVAIYVRVSLRSTN